MSLVPAAQNREIARPNFLCAVCDTFINIRDC